MRYLGKRDDSEIVREGWRYPRDRERIAGALRREQRGFCAYSERYLQPIDAAEIEHIDPRDKDTDRDGYRNGYLVLRWMNLHKRRDIERFLPLLPPTAGDISRRITYRHGQFLPVDPADREADNLITWLGFNRPELAQERADHVRRVRRVLRLIGDEQLQVLLRDDPFYASFATALEAELGIAVPLPGENDP